MQHTTPFMRIALAIGLVGALGAVAAFGVAPLTERELPPEQRVTLPVALSASSPEGFEQFLHLDTIRRGDTLALVLQRAGVVDSEFLQFVANDPIGRRALQMQPGRGVRIETDDPGRVLRFVYRPGAALEETDAGRGRAPARIEIQRIDGRYVATEQAPPLERGVELRSVTIEGSAAADLEVAGLPANLADQINTIFVGAVDLHRDLRRGDRLRVVYESLREEGSLEPARAGRVLAVELDRGGRRDQAYWFERAGRGEYFAGDGRSLERAFLRNPVESGRLSSGYSDARLSPIHQDWRAHRGVDLYAPEGTPVRAAADGLVELVEAQRGYGNMIVIRHRSPYTTLYAHLREFSAGLRPGTVVKRGDVIGTVGATGWATGPHLHYELKVNGEQVDPMTAELPEGRPLEGADRMRFFAKVGALREQLARLDALRLARFE